MISLITLSLSLSLSLALGAYGKLSRVLSRLLVRDFAWALLVFFENLHVEKEQR